MLDYIFAACCGIMYGMGELFGQTYEFVNVIMFCFVEPIFTALMAAAACYVLLRGPHSRQVALFFKWFALIVCVATILLLAVSGAYALHITDLGNLTQSEIQSMMHRAYRHDPSPFIHEAYMWTYNWLMSHSSGLGQYARLNLYIYVIGMPSIITASWVVCHRKAA